MISITIDGKSIQVPEGTTILNAANSADIYIPVLCSHPDLGPFQTIELSDQIYQGDKIYTNDQNAMIDNIKGCGLCQVELENEANPISACETQVEDGMVVFTNTELLKDTRRKNLLPIMANHPHACLTCSQRIGCITLSADCPNSVIINERCCEINGNCELQRIADYIGIAPETPKFHHIGIPRIEDEGLFIRDYNLCIACGRCVRACQQLRNVFALGAVINNGKLIIGTTAGKYLSEAQCRFCGACVEVCPTGAIQDKVKHRLKEYSDYLPCRANCPGDTDIPSYLKFIAEDNPQASAEVIASKLSFPHSLGKICFHPCEFHCRRNGLTSAINIRGAKDYAMTNSELPPPIRKPNTGKKISIIGAGPAGLTAGYYLSLKGHNVTIYEKEEKIGGMLQYGIPKYRLPEEILSKDLYRIMQSGIEVKVNSEIGKELTINSLLENTTDAVLIATGLSKSKNLDIPIPQSDNSYYGIEFLNSVAKREIPTTYFAGKEVIVVGGGNVASDSARTALRLGAKKITIICLEKAGEMPAYKQEIEEAIDEGIIILNGWGIDSITEADSINLTLIKCISVFDDNGKFSPQYDLSIKNQISTDAIIFCIGQVADLSQFDPNMNQLFNNGLIRTKQGTYKTNIEGLFAVGDIVSGPKSVIDAIGSAKQVAREIDIYLDGDGIIYGDNIADIEFNERIGKINDFYKLERIPQQIANPTIRKTNFEQIEYCYDTESAIAEASRCLQCNLRMKINRNPYPPDKYIEFNLDNLNLVRAEEGVVQLLNASKEVFIIKGTENMQKTLLDFYNDGKDAKYFVYEFDPLYSKKESELVQQFLQKYGKMPDTGDCLDDLF